MYLGVCLGGVAEEDEDEDGYEVDEERHPHVYRIVERHDQGSHDHHEDGPRAQQ